MHRYIYIIIVQALCTVVAVVVAAIFLTFLHS